jgi:hypothetical protein
MKAVLPGGFEPPRKNHQAATIRMSKDSDQIDLSGVVTPVADFPAHCF